MLRFLMWVGFALIGYAIYACIQRNDVSFPSAIAGTFILFILGPSKLHFGHQLRLAKKGKVSWCRSSSLKNQRQLTG